ncbi:MAG TPA: hypothetical protein VGN83_27330 [Falsiroseomonas sp.]|jgi:hypothetical protein|nr:hypothetical protein [Falsiroseomonas sp.]
MNQHGLLALAAPRQLDSTGKRLSRRSDEAMVMRAWVFGLTICMSAWTGASGTAAAQTPDFIVSRLRDIPSIHIVATPVTASAPEGSCVVAPNPLEDRAAAMLRAAGLPTATSAEVMKSIREQLRLSQADVRALVQGRRLAPDPEDQRRRQAELDDMQKRPTLTVRLDIVPVGAGGATLCALVAAPQLRAWTAGRATLAVNGREVQASLLVWEGRSRSLVTQDADVAAGAWALLGPVLTDFLTDWRRANPQ